MAYRIFATDLPFRREAVGGDHKTLPEAHFALALHLEARGFEVLDEAHDAEHDAMDVAAFRGSTIDLYAIEPV